MARSFPIRKPKTDLGVHGVEKALAIRAKYVGGLGCSLTYMVAKVDRKEHCVSSMSFTGKLVPTMTEKNIFLDAEDLRTEGGRSKSTSVAVSAPPLGSVPHSHSAADIKDLKPTRQHSEPHEIALVNSYELIRLGYLVFGDKYLITFDEWDLLSSIVPFRSFCHFWND
ncbi:hypothetical protein V7S43_013392 [Phytophthora oleae]|uniref:Uncharacterized protein n=1 Tax=Phytophthora oleae TaxID=2107226 RepID=A0ABD3F4G4_9STRA